MAGFGSKGEITTFVYTFYPDGESEGSDKGIEVPMDCISTSDDGMFCAMSPAEGYKIPDFARRPKETYSAPSWNDVSEGFIDPFLEKLRKWNEFGGFGNEIEIDDRLEDLKTLLLPIAWGVGWQYGVESWQRAKTHLAVDAPGACSIFQEKVDDLLKQVQRVASKSIEDKSRTLPFLNLQISELCRFLETLSGKLQLDSKPQTDGPIGFNAWLREGKKVDGRLQPMTWRLLNHLWWANDRTAEVEDLAEPVFGDRNITVEKQNLGRQRKLANDFFKRYDLPFRVTISGFKICLVNA